MVAISVVKKVNKGVHTIWWRRHRQDPAEGGNMIKLKGEDQVECDKIVEASQVGGDSSREQVKSKVTKTR